MPQMLTTGMCVRNVRCCVYIYICCAVLSRSVMSYSATPWTVAHQAPLSVGFPRQEYWSGLLFPPPGHLPGPETEPESLPSSALAGEFYTTAPPGKPNVCQVLLLYILQ